MGFGLSLVRFALGIAALWLIATTYQHLIVHEVTTAAADPPRIMPAIDVHPVDWSNCRVGLNGTSAGAQGGCGLGAPQGQDVIPQNQN